MNISGSYSRALPWLSALVLGTLLTACGGGGRDPILGFGGVAPARPTVTAVTPVPNASGVPVNNTVINAEFSEPMAALTGTATFALSCAAPCASPGGTVSLDPTNRIATLALTPGTTLSPNTLYTATVTAARSLGSGLSMAQPYVWQFTTSATIDTTRPRVVFTIPATSTPGPTPGVPTATAISAFFTEDMAPASLSAGTFTVTCAAPCQSPAGSVSYVVSGRTAMFTPVGPLAAGTTYTATLSTGVTDLAGNALAGNQAALPAASAYIWTFTTAAAGALPPVVPPVVPPIVPPAGLNVSVMSVTPAVGATGVCPAASVNATFNVPSGLRMNPATINSGVFTVTGPAPGLTPVVAATVQLDPATGRIATFTPLAPLVAGTTYTASIRGGATGATDMALPGNQLVSDFVWTFTVGVCPVGVIPPLVPLGTASSFGTFGGSAGMTNSGILTVINGDIGTTAASTSVTGFHDAGPGCTYTETGSTIGTVNGLIYTAAPPPTPACPSEGNATTFGIALQARADALAAYNALTTMPAGSDPGAGNLASLVLAPGVYTAAGGSFMIRGGNLTLDGQGNANAVWVFQMATSLTVGGPGAAFPQSVTLINGAQAKNVFWQVGSAATINAGGGGNMVGTIISRDGVTFSTFGAVALTILDGRALSLGASVTMVNTVINVPAP